MLGKKEDESIYKDCKKLAKIRNRVHIQNAKQDKPKDEFKLWTPPLINFAGESLRKICEVMYKHYPRPNHFHLTSYRSPVFPEPWKEII